MPKSLPDVAFGSALAAEVRMPRLADRTDPGTSSLVSAPVLNALARVADLATVTLVGLLIALAYVADARLSPGAVYPTAIALMGVLTVGAFEVFGLYTVSSLAGVLHRMARIVLAWTIAFAMLVAALVFLKIGSEVSRVWLAAWFIAGATALIGERIVLAAVARRWLAAGRLLRRAAVYGANDAAESLLAALERDPGSDIRIVGVFDDRDGGRSPRMLAGYPNLGGLDDLVATARRSRIDIVIVTLPMAAEDRLATVLKSLSVLPVDIKLPAHASAIRFSPRTYSRIGGVAMIDLCDKPISDWGAVAKWLFDKSVALAALVLLAPVMLAIAAAVKLDSRGPVLFRQKRYGLNNELISVFKFRSMYTDRCDAAAAKLVTRDDPRVTRVGRFIRKTSLDELPQLFNVLLGDLSLVGPRPHAVQAKAGNALYDAVVDGYFARHKVKPGITGWAQVNGWRGETDTPEKIQRRVEHDLYYIENWSVVLDVYILARTPFALLATDNAY